MGNLMRVFDVSTETITWDSLHILLTLAIYVTLLMVIGKTRIYLCRDNMLRDNVNGRRDPDTDIPKCLSGKAGVHA